MFQHSRAVSNKYLKYILLIWLRDLTKYELLVTAILVLQSNHREIALFGVLW